jgi:hypothetical protein
MAQLGPVPWLPRSRPRRHSFLKPQLGQDDLSAPLFHRLNLSWSSKRIQPRYRLVRSRHQAVGGVNLLMLAVESGADRFVCARPMLSHYEVEVTGDPRRISDTEWRGRGGRGGGILDKVFPADLSSRRVEGLTPPIWTKSYLVPR